MDRIPRLAERIQHLYEVVPQPDGSPYTNDAVAAELARLGISASVAQIANLRSGRQANPSAILLRGIAKVFGVPLEYFFDDDTETSVKDELEALVALRSVRGVRLRGDLDLTGLSQILKAFATIQGTDSAGQPDEGP